MLYSHPNIYARAITEEVRQQLDDKAKTLFTNNPSFVRRDPLRRTTTLKSLGNKQFASFAKDNQYKGGIFFIFDFNKICNTYVAFYVFINVLLSSLLLYNALLYCSFFYFFNKLGCFLTTF